MHLVQGVLLALLHRARTGRGQMDAVSLLDSMIAAQMQEATAHMMRGREVNWGAMPLSGVFPTTDGAVVLVGAFKADPLRDIANALEIPALADDPRFATHELRVANKAALHEIFRKRFAAYTSARLLERLEEQDLLCAPVRTLAEALADEQTAINGMVLETQGPTEKIRVVGSPVHLSEAPVTIRIVPPALGEHTEEVLAALMSEAV
jgi:crotonobetainyl-CoA:carnitine CoA-transferase CaiB-like acyl-CoA transferase